MDRLRSGTAGFLLFLAFAPLAMAETFTVTKTEDDDGPCTPDDCALREAVIAANALDGADRIVLSSGVYTLTINGTGDESASMTGDLDILDDLEVVGDPSGRTVIEAQVDDRVMEIGFSVVTFSDVEITGGHCRGGGTSPFGGCIRMLLSDVTFVDSSITNCYCQYEGGGFAVELANVTFISSTLSNNESETLGGAIFHSTIEPEQGLTLINTTVSGNRAGIAGGGIFQRNDGETLISHSTIAYNEAPFGDALFLDFPVRRTWVENSVLEGKCRGLLPSPRGVNVAGPDVTAQFPVTPAIPLPKASETLTSSGSAKSVFTAAVCSSPPALVIAARAPWSPVAAPVPAPSPTPPSNTSSSAPGSGS